MLLGTWVLKFSSKSSSNSRVCFQPAITKYFGCVLTRNGFGFKKRLCSKCETFKLHVIATVHAALAQIPQRCNYEHRFAHPDPMFPQIKILSSLIRGSQPLLSVRKKQRDYWKVGNNTDSENISIIDSDFKMNY